MKGIVSALLTLVAAAGLVVLPAVTAVHAQCTNATLTGNYGVILQGFTTFKGPNNEVPIAVAGLVTFDGAGNASISWSSAFNGAISTGLNSSGPYTVNSDCTGSWAITKGDSAGLFSSNLVIISGGAEVFGLDTAPANTISFELKKQ
jgi:hypothetical protein